MARTAFLQIECGQPWISGYHYSAVFHTVYTSLYIMCCIPDRRQQGFKRWTKRLIRNKLQIQNCRTTASSTWLLPRCLWAPHWISRQSSVYFGNTVNCTTNVEGWLIDYDDYENIFIYVDSESFNTDMGETHSLMHIPPYFQKGELLCKM